jgi:hypothetical protein
MMELFPYVRQPPRALRTETCDPIFQLPAGNLLRASPPIAENPPRTLDKKEEASLNTKVSRILETGFHGTDKIRVRL